jgi:hypothetical protein
VRTFARIPTVKKITPEKAVQNAVVKLLRWHGWMVQRNQQGLGAERGRPDVEAYRNGFTLFIEFKAPKHKMANGKMSPGGQLSRYQVDYIDRLRAQDMTVLIVDDPEKVMLQLEEIQERLWPGKGIRRIC